MKVNELEQPRKDHTKNYLNQPRFKRRAWPKEMRALLPFDPRPDGPPPRLAMVLRLAENHGRYRRKLTWEHTSNCVCRWDSGQTLKQRQAMRRLEELHAVYIRGVWSLQAKRVTTWGNPKPHFYLTSGKKLEAGVGPMGWESDDGAACGSYPPLEQVIWVPLGEDADPEFWWPSPR